MAIPGNEALMLRPLLTACAMVIEAVLPARYANGCGDSEGAPPSSVRDAWRPTRFRAATAPCRPGDPRDPAGRPGLGREASAGRTAGRCGQGRGTGRRRCPRDGDT